MKKKLTNALVFLANVYAFCLCWGAYWLCWSVWWAVVVAAPAGWSWCRDKALPWIGVVILALILDVIALLTWLSSAAREPKTAARQVSDKLAENAVSLAGWCLKLLFRAINGVSYHGKFRRLAPVSAESSGGVVVMPALPLLSAFEMELVEDQQAVQGEDVLPVLLLTYSTTNPALPLLAHPSLVVEEASDAEGQDQESRPAPTPLATLTPTHSTAEGEHDLTTKALAMIARGMSNRAVARALGVADSTLRSRLKKVLVVAA